MLNAFTTTVGRQRLRGLASGGRAYLPQRSAAPERGLRHGGCAVRQAQRGMDPARRFHEDQRKHRLRRDGSGSARDRQVAHGAAPAHGHQRRDEGKSPPSRRSSWPGRTDLSTSTTCSPARPPAIPSSWARPAAAGLSVATNGTPILGRGPVQQPPGQQDGQERLPHPQPRHQREAAPHRRRRQGQKTAITAVSLARPSLTAAPAP